MTTDDYAGVHREPVEAPSNLRTMLSAKAAKAYVAGAIAAASAATLAADKGLTLAEAFTIVGAALVAFQGVYWTSNADSVSPTD